MKNYYQTHEEQRKIKGDRASIYNKSKDRIRIYVRVSDYIKQGKIIKKPCEVCGDKNVHGHHKDYSKPLELTSKTWMRSNQLQYFLNHRYPQRDRLNALPSTAKMFKAFNLSTTPKV